MVKLPIKKKSNMLTEQYQPGIHKLIHHIDHLKKIKNKEVCGPIHLSFWPNSDCQFRCEYCMGKNIKNRIGEISLEEYKSMVDVLVTYGLKALEFSGAIGEPLLWKYFNAAVEYAHTKNLKMSLITNGIKLTDIPDSIISKLSWIRVSIQSLNHLKTIDLNKISKLTRISCSYIVSNDLENMEEIKDIFYYVREKKLITRIAIQRPAEKQDIEILKVFINQYGDPLFFSDKELGKPLGCYIPWVRAAVDWNGNFLPCPSIQLNYDCEGKIPEGFALCHIKDLEAWLINNPPHDLGYRCEYCNCGKEINDMIYNLQEGVEDVEFV
jgi:MoaA/NifB/PqqE/SkfB family radical SAM enzyme